MWPFYKEITPQTRLINKIYQTGSIPEDFRKSIFVPIPKVSKAQECSDFRTIALMSHASKVMLHVIKRRITPIIERQLGDIQMFQKGKMHNTCYFQVRMISERIIHWNREKEIQEKMITKKQKNISMFC